MRYRVRLETYIYFHTQTPGYQVRKKKIKNGETIYDVSRYFGVSKHGSRRGAAIAAKNWKNRNIRRW